MNYYWIAYRNIDKGPFTGTEMAKRQLHHPNVTPAQVRAHKDWKPGVYGTTYRKFNKSPIIFLAILTALPFLFSWELLFSSTPYIHNHGEEGVWGSIVCLVIFMDFLKFLSCVFQEFNKFFWKMNVSPVFRTYVLRRFSTIRDILSCMKVLHNNYKAANTCRSLQIWFILRDL